MCLPLPEVFFVGCERAISIFGMITDSTYFRSNVDHCRCELLCIEQCGTEALLVVKSDVKFYTMQRESKSDDWVKLVLQRFRSQVGFCVSYIPKRSLFISLAE